MDPRIRDLLVQTRRDLEREYGERLTDLRLFGSFARGEAEPMSDVDLLVVLRGPVRPAAEVFRTGGLISDLCLHFGRVLNCVFLDDEHYRTGTGPFLRNVKRESVPV